MKKSVIFIILLAALGLAQGVGAQVWEEWVARYNGPGDSTDTVTDLAVDANGNVYVTGYCWGSGTNFDYVTIKYNSGGQQQWIAHYDGLVNYIDRASSLCIDVYSNVYVTGTSVGGFGPNYDYTTIKYNSAGQQQWVAHYNGPGNDGDNATSLAVDRNSNVNVYVTGSSDGGWTDSDYATIKYNAAGDTLWVSRYDGPANENDYAYCLVVDGNGNVYVAGCSAGGGETGYDYATVKYSAAGQLLWVARYNGMGNSYDSPTSLAVDGDGNVYVTGGSSSDYATIKYNSEGQQQWVARYNGPQSYEDEATSLALDGSGNVYVTGISRVAMYDYDYATIKYNSEGQQQWVARYDTTQYIYSNAARSIAVDNEGNVYVTGSSAGYVWYSEYATVKYNAYGQQQWVVRYAGPGDGNDWATSLAVHNNGNVSVTGVSYGGIGTDDNFATIKYSQSPPFEITLTPLNPPITIPANGGSFNFNASVVNNGSNQTPFAVWARIKYPDGTYTAPTIGPVTINPPIGVTVTRQRTQNVPAVWPSGEYTYIGYANPTFAYPAVDSSSFPFTKLATADSGLWIIEATCTGEPFPGETISAEEFPPFIRGDRGELLKLSPNPFNPTTTISYELRAASCVSLKVYDTAGRMVAELVNAWREAGQHQVNFDGSNLASGVYLYSLQAGNYSAIGKMVLMK